MLVSKLSQDLTIFQKIRNMDFFLLISIFLLGLVSIITMYSTDGGEILYHTKSHFIRFLIFFPMMIILSFSNIKFWHSTSYLFYAIVLGLLIWVSLYGIQASGSKRWINLYFINLQPSELMKIGVILCLAKFFHRIRSEKTNTFASIIISVTIIIVPTTLVVSQPDLGTSILIAITGFVVLWFTGLKMKYFMYSGILFLISLFGNSM